MPGLLQISGRRPYTSEFTIDRAGQDPAAIPVLRWTFGLDFFATRPPVQPEFVRSEICEHCPDHRETKGPSAVRHTS